jgi:hypothetical protein
MVSLMPRPLYPGERVPIVICVIVQYRNERFCQTKIFFLNENAQLTVADSTTSELVAHPFLTLLACKLLLGQLDTTC